VQVCQPFCLGFVWGKDCGWKFFFYLAHHLFQSPGQSANKFAHSKKCFWSACGLPPLCFQSPGQGAGEVSVEKRSEQTKQRFERVDKRFEQVDKRMASKITFIKILLGIFTAMTIATIGFAIWDRRSASRLVEQRVIEVARTAGDEDDKKWKIEELGKEGLSGVYEELRTILRKTNLFDSGFYFYHRFLRSDS